MLQNRISNGGLSGRATNLVSPFPPETVQKLNNRVDELAHRFGPATISKVSENPPSLQFDEDKDVMLEIRFRNGKGRKIQFNFEIDGDEENDEAPKTPTDQPTKKHCPDAPIKHRVYEPSPCKDGEHVWHYGICNFCGVDDTVDIEDFADNEVQADLTAAVVSSKEDDEEKKESIEKPTVEEEKVSTTTPESIVV